MEDIKYYSFDMFDTIITRLLNKPSDLFLVIEKKYNINNFKKNRIKAEKNARKVSKYEEVTLEEIYCELKKIDSKIDLTNTMRLEKRLEIDFCVVNDNFINKFNKLVNEGKNVIITTDMYLDEYTIKKILAKNKIKYDKLYLSSSIKKTKHSGNLFKYILNDLKITPNQIIHYGDNRQSDYINPKKYGIKAFLVKNDWTNLTIYNKKEKDYNYLALEKFINANLKDKYTEDSYNYFYKSGYQILGPLIYEYCCWLNNNVNDKALFFLSRDGKIIKKAYDIIFPKSKTHYMYASRRALIVPTLHFYSELKNPKYLSEIYNLKVRLNIHSFLKMVGLDDSELSKILEKYNYKLDDIINEEYLSTNENFIDFYNEIYPLIINNSKKEYENMVKYLKKIDFRGEVAIVDIGWNGNMQYALEKAVKIAKFNTKIDGYYVGVSPKSKKQDIQSMHGYLYQKNYNEWLEDNKRWYNAIFEFFFSSTDGSLKRYTNYGVECYEYEYKNSFEEKYLEKIQEGAIDFISNYTNSILSKFIKLDSKIIITNFNKLGNSPSKEDLKYFKKINFYDSDILPFVFNSKGSYVFHPISFIRDFKKSLWKPGFLNSFLLPSVDYSKILTIFKRK